MHAILRESFITQIRRELFKAISQRPGGPQDWAYIVGKKSRDKKGHRIILSDHANTELQKVVDWLNSEEMEEELRELGLEPPDHIDGLVEWIQGAKTDRVMKADEFRLFQKHKNLIIRYLAKVL